jgi:hypothetical protein
MKWDETRKVKMKLTIKRSIDGRMRRNGGGGDSERYAEINI